MLGLAFFSSNLSKKNCKTCKTQIIPTLGTKHSHVGNEVFPRVGKNPFLKKKESWHKREAVSLHAKRRFTCSERGQQG